MGHCERERPPFPNLGRGAGGAQRDARRRRLLRPTGRAEPRTPRNLRVCPRGAWNERMPIETLLPMVHRVCRLKYLWYRAAVYLAYVAALVDALLTLNARAAPSELYSALRLAQHAR